MYRRNKLLEDRKTRLEGAGFVWDCNAMRDDEAFHENYEKLLAFKEARGDANIPNKYRRDRPFGRWAAKMRELYALDQLDADRKKALNDVGFVWNPPEAGVAQPGSQDEADDEEEEEEEEEEEVSSKGDEDSVKQVAEAKEEPTKVETKPEPVGEGEEETSTSV